MDANFFYCSVYDRFIQRQPCAWVHLKTFSLKKLLKNYWPRSGGSVVCRTHDLVVVSLIPG